MPVNSTPVMPSIWKAFAVSSVMLADSVLRVLQVPFFPHGHLINLILSELGILRGGTKRHAAEVP